MKNKKRIVISLIIIIAIPIIYYFYCNLFWKAFFNNYRNYGFKISSVLEKDSSISYYNYKNYTWKRIIIEPRHSQWINKTKLHFLNDSLLFVTVTPSYMEGHELTFPLLFPLSLEDEEKPYNSLYKIRNDSLFNIKTKHYFAKIELENSKILIKEVFL